MLEKGALVSDRYRVEALLGEGGMGAVYRAEHVLMHKPVALKVLHGDVSNHAEIRTRFGREAMAGAHIDHPNVAAATDFGELPDGSFFLVMEYIAGKSLRALLDDGKVEPARAIKIARGILAGLAAAHAKGIVHRDLKPENVVLVDKNGDPDFVKILDFGIAKLDPNELSRTRGPASSPLTRVGAIMGTPEYMAPEQALGDPVDHRADLYALGVILYEMLSGVRPFDGGALTLMKAHALLAPPPLPDDLGSVVGSERLGVILKRTMAKMPEDRFQSAGELTLALAEVQSLASLPRLPAAPSSASTMSRIAVATPAHEPAPSPTSPTVFASAAADVRPRWMKAAIAAPAVFAVVVLAIALSLRGSPKPPAPAVRERAVAIHREADRPQKHLIVNVEEREKPRRRGLHLPFF
jgi:serine/threonine-protein kinase